jgi:hypothetical protein
MHIHLPKPLHGWRAFAGEVGIVLSSDTLGRAPKEMQGDAVAVNAAPAAVNAAVKGFCTPMLDSSAP